MEVNFAVDGVTDSLADTVHYGVVAEAVARVVAGESHRLLERLAVRIADDVLGVDRRIAAVTVTVRKLRPPVALDLASAGVRVTRLAP